MRRENHVAHNEMNNYFQHVELTYSTKQNNKHEKTECYVIITSKVLNIGHDDWENEENNVCRDNKNESKKIEFSSCKISSPTCKYSKNSSKYGNTSRCNWKVIDTKYNTKWLGLRFICISTWKNNSDKWQANTQQSKNLI